MSKISVARTRGNISEEERRVKKAIRKFLYYFPGGFEGKKYVSWERDYKWQAHLQWQISLSRDLYRELLDEEKYLDIANIAVRIESRTNLLFSFEKMALRDAVKTKETAKLFAENLFQYIYGEGELRERFDNYRDALGMLPVKQTRVLTWPLQTVFGFIADPQQHIFLKPTVTKTAAIKYGFDFNYQSRPNFTTYQSLLQFADKVKQDTRDLKPKDMVDVQSFIWVQGSEEYPD